MAKKQSLTERQSDAGVICARTHPFAPYCLYMRPLSKTCSPESCGQSQTSDKRYNEHCQKEAFEEASAKRKEERNRCRRSH
mgnify:CR=1 FL=1